MSAWFFFRLAVVENAAKVLNQPVVSYLFIPRLKWSINKIPTVYFRTALALAAHVWTGICRKSKKSSFLNLFVITRAY